MKRLSRIVVLIIFAIVLSGCSLFSGNRKLSMTNEEIQARITELDNGDYIFSPDEKYLKVDQESYAIYYNNLLNVYLHQDLSGKEKEELALAVNGKLVSNVTGSVNFIQIMVPDFEMDELEQLRTKLYETGKVLFVNYETRSLQEETATFSGELVENGTWWKNAIDADRAWKYSSLLTDDAVVGIVDSGFDTENGIFQNDGKSKIHVLDNNTPADHGTAVAGLIAANNSDNSNVIGVFSEAGLVCVNKNKQSSDFALYINRMIESKARVINHSYGYTLYDKNNFQKSVFTIDLAKILNCKPDEIVYDSYILYLKEQASNFAQGCITVLIDLLVSNKDCLMVSAAGNGYNGNFCMGCDLSIGYTGQFISVSPEEYKKWVNNSPYAYDEDYFLNNDITYDRLKEHIIVVAAVSSNTNDQGVYELCKGSNYGSLVDIAAPGEKICCSGTNNQEFVQEGTSLASPIVAGSAAYIWALNPTLTGSEVKECLISTSGSAVGVTNEDAGREYKMLDFGTAAYQAVLGSVHFTVKDKESGDTIEGVTCDFSSDISDDITGDECFFSPLNTRDDGELFLLGIGTVHITLSKKGYETYTFDIPVSVKEDVELGDIYLEQDKRNLKRVQIYNYNDLEEPYFESEYTFNDEGQLINEVSEYTGYYNNPERYTYRYDQSGRLVSKLSDSGEPYQYPEDITRTYDSQGYLIQEKGIVYGEEKMTVDYTYDGDGRVATEQWYSDGTTVASYSHAYEVSSDGTVIDKKHHTDSFADQEEMVYIYDSSGRKIQGFDEYYYSDAKYQYIDDPYFDIVFIYRPDDDYSSVESAYAYLRDEAGAVIEEIDLGSNPSLEYDNDGYLKTVWSAFTYITFEYDGNRGQGDIIPENTSYGTIDNIPHHFTFQSGVGAWETDLYINDDWSFNGTYHDADADRVQICEFTGNFSEPVQVNDYTYATKVLHLKYEDEGREYDKDGNHYITAKPYGLEGTGEFMIYLPGAPISELPEDFAAWTSLDSKSFTALPSNFYGLYNIDESSVFIARSSSNLWGKEFYYSYGGCKSSLWAKNDGYSYLTFWPSNGEASINVLFYWSDENKTELNGYDYISRSGYHISLEVTPDCSSVHVKLTSRVKEDLTAWGGTEDGHFEATYKGGN